MDKLKVKLSVKKVISLTNEKENLEFEKALEKLEEIVKKLESGELSLSESLDNFKLCRNELNEAEEKVEKVLKDNNGEFNGEVPFDDEEE